MNLTIKRIGTIIGLTAAIMLFAPSVQVRAASSDSERTVTDETDAQFIDRVLKRAIDKVLYRIRTVTESVAGDDKPRDFAGDALRRLTRPDNDLRITDDQRAKLRAIVNEYEKIRVRTEADLKVAELDLQGMIPDETAKLSEIEAALKKSEAAQTALRLEGIKAVRNAATVLTPEQREKVKASLSAWYGG